MKFITNTKPLADALALGIVNANVSKFHSKSNIVQLAASERELTINIEADRIVTELTLKGSGDSNSSPVAMVDSLLFKQLIGTLSSSTVTIEFVEGGIVLHSGSSKFTIPNKADVEGSVLAKPTLPEYSANSISVLPENWKYVQNKQMFAIAMNFTSPIYTLVWAGDNGKVLVGDAARAIFTQSSKSTVQSTCLFKDSVINLLASLPEGAKMIRSGNSYVVTVSTDGFDMVTEIIPMYESDEVGSYNSDLVLHIFEDLGDYVSISPEAVKVVLGQADLLSTNTASDILFKLQDGKLLLKDDNVESYLEAPGSLDGVECKLITSLLYQAVSKFESDTIKVYAHIVDDELSGIILTDGDLYIVMAGND